MVEVDVTDFQILARLHVDPFASHEELGRHAGATGTTVTKRLKRLADGGVLEGFGLMPAADLLGRVRRHRSYQPAQKIGAHEIVAIDPVVMVNERHDGSVSVFTAERASQPADEILSGLLGNPVFISPLDTPRPASKTTISPLDWRLLDALMRTPRASAVDWAKHCHLSPKTVRARRSKLLQDGQIQAAPLLQLANAGGLVIHEMAVLVADASTAAAVDAAMGEAIRIGTAAGGRGLYYFCYAPTVQEAFARQRRLRGLPGVMDAVAQFPRRRAFADERVAAWVAEQGRALERKQRTRPEEFVL
jgi:DNA-binding Lrp family transcriptional regulator